MAADFETLPIPSKTIPELAELAPGDVADPDLIIVHDVSTAAERKFSFASLKTFLVNYFYSLFPILVPNVAALSSIAAVAGRVYYLREYHAGGVLGGGNLIGYATSVTPDNASSFSGSVGTHFKRAQAQKTPYEAGYLDGDADASVAINKITDAYGSCYLDAGKNYNIQYTVYARKLVCNGGKATLNCTSPTANTRFGTTGAAVFCSPNPLFGDTTLTGLLSGVHVENIRVNCNWLINATGSSDPQPNSLKGFMHYRNDNFLNVGTSVYECGSYGYWPCDDSTTGTLYCSGKIENTYAEDCGVAYEYVNTRGVVLENCHGYISGVLPIYPEAIFHGYGGTDLRVTHNNCTGISDGPVNAIFLALLSCVNVTFNNNCQLINRYDNGATIQAAVIFEPSGTSNFNNINFNNCILHSEYTAALALTIGSTGGTTNSVNFTDCEINGMGATVSIGGSNGGRYSFTACEIIARATGVVTPIGINATNTPLSVQVTGGLVKASTTGSGVPTITNLSGSIFNGTNLDPAGTQPPKIRQKVNAIYTCSGDGSTYANINVILPQAVLNWTSAAVNTTRIDCDAKLDYGLSGAATFPAAVTLASTAIMACAMPANNVVRFVGAQVNQGKIFRCGATEYEP